MSNPTTGFITPAFLRAVFLGLAVRFLLAPLVLISIAVGAATIGGCVIFKGRHAKPSKPDHVQPVRPDRKPFHPFHPRRLTDPINPVAPLDPLRSIRIW